MDTSKLRFGSVQNLYLELETLPLTELFRSHLRKENNVQNLCPSNEKSVAAPEFPRMVSCFKIVQKRITSNCLSAFLTLHYICVEKSCAQTSSREPLNVSLLLFTTGQWSCWKVMFPIIFPEDGSLYDHSQYSPCLYQTGNPFPQPWSHPQLPLTYRDLPSPPRTRPNLFTMLPGLSESGRLAFVWSTFLFYYSRQRNNTRLYTGRSEAAVITVSSTGTLTTVSGWSPKRWTPYSNNPTASSTSTTSDQRKSKESSMRLILGELR